MPFLLSYKNISGQLFQAFRALKCPQFSTAPVSTTVLFDERRSLKKRGMINI